MITIFGSELLMSSINCSHVLSLNDSDFSFFSTPVTRWPEGKGVHSLLVIIFGHRYTPSKILNYDFTSFHKYSGL